MRRQPGQLPISHMIKYSADFSVDGIRPEIHEPYAIILELRRRNQRIVWRNGLRSVSHIEIGGDYYFVAITVERGMKCWIAIVLAGQTSRRTSPRAHPPPNRRSSRSAQISRDHGNGRSVIS